MWMFTENGTWQKGGWKGEDGKTFEEQGFHDQSQIGSERYGNWVSIHSNETSYIIGLHDTNSYLYIFCENDPAMLEFLRLHGYAWVNSGIHEAIDEIRTILIDREDGIFSEQVRDYERRRDRRQKAFADAIRARDRAKAKVVEIQTKR